MSPPPGRARGVRVELYLPERAVLRHVGPLATGDDDREEEPRSEIELLA